MQGTDFDNDDRKAEIMSQSYITYGLNANIKVALGTFYASKPGFKPAAAIHFIKKTNDFLFLLVPRVDLWKNASVEAMMLLEYRPIIYEQVNFLFKGSANE